MTIWQRIKNWWKKRRGVSQAVQNEDYRTQRGFLGEDAFNWLLTYNETTYTALNRQLVLKKPEFPGFQIGKTYFKWLNYPKESYLPFDFIINGNAVWDYGKVDLQKIDDEPIVLIDVKTTTKHAANFFRSQKENTRVEELIQQYGNVFYFIVLVIVPNQNVNNIQNMQDWEVRFLSREVLPLYQIGSDSEKLSYHFSA